ncbi:hypothetical protein [Paenibacillus sp. Soil787]|uniref:hypothetical protein n=1 Tax=Paenibacillus sp. Soil787 TaxID=1736411 RepID=UPI0007028E5F|nr:hypothetical protein [Paenibacillus sp. Soil787]KRF20195.1 hypothetical protein ASG93_31280 [Paenibacillus sp. Soil787]
MKEKYGDSNYNLVSVKQKWMILKGKYVLVNMISNRENKDISIVYYPGGTADFLSDNSLNYNISKLPFDIWGQGVVMPPTVENH